MEIKSIETKHITEQPFKGLVADYEFEPFYQTVIRYTHPRDGERPDRIYSVTGTGDSEYASEQDAQSNLRYQISIEANDAVSKFWSDQGVYFVDC